MPGQVLCLAAAGDERARAVAECMRRHTLFSGSDRHAYFAVSYLLGGARVPAGYPTTEVISHLSGTPG